MNYVLAFIDQDTCKPYTNINAIPQGSQVFSSPEELAAVLTPQSMDKIRGKVLDEAVEPSPSRDVAASRLWYVLGLGVHLAKVDWTNQTGRSKDAFGNSKTQDVTPIELIQFVWVPGRHHMDDFFYRKLPKQARQIADMLRDDGRGIWTMPQATEVLLARESEIKTRQGLLLLWNIYRPELFLKKILRRVSYLDFASKPEFAEISKEVKEDFDDPQ